MQKYLLYSAAFVYALLIAPALAESVYIEELTSPEIAEKIKSGTTTVIIPTGGSEQNLKHLTIGKHNYIVHYTAGEIAKNLGNTLVAPTMSYVPEGEIKPPQGHMNFAGTISLRPETFAMVLEDTAASFKQHGFKLICFLGDSGDNQKMQEEVAKKLSKQWKEEGVIVLQVANYYSNNGQDAWVATLKLPLKNPAGHASFEDSSELMAVNKTAVREKLLEGDAKFASEEFGNKLLELKIKTAIKQINNVHNSQNNP